MIDYKIILVYIVITQPWGYALILSQSIIFLFGDVFNIVITNKLLVTDQEDLAIWWLR